jgi:hypothetical protein
MSTSASSKSRSKKQRNFAKVKAKCTPKKLIEFSKKHYTYINQIFGDATVRQIIEEEYPTTWEFHVAKAGPEFGNSFHHTIRDRDDPDLFVCSVMDDIQDLHKNVNDNLCQSYSLMSYFEIPIQASGKKEEQTEISQERNQMSMVEMYRDILNGTLENYEGIDFKEILTNEILSVKKNKKLWRNFVSGKGHINMDPTNFFKNIEDALDEWQEYGYWFFIGKGECPTHSTYSAEMNYLKDRSQELSNERHEGHDMGLQDVNIGRSKSKSTSNSETRKNKSSSVTRSTSSNSKSKKNNRSTSNK